jgi:transposase
MDHSEKMFKLVKKFSESGMSQKKFSKEHELSSSTFAYWVKKWKQQQATVPAFVKIEKPSPKISNTDIFIIYPNGVQIKAPGDMGLVKQLINL